MKADSLKKIIEITLAVYRLAEKFPGDEPLKNRIKEGALDILKNFVAGDFNGIIKSTQVLTGYFKVARNQCWVEEINYQILEKAYQRIYENGFTLPKKEALKNNRTANQRQQIIAQSKKRRKQIINLIKQNPDKKVSFSYILGQIKNTSERTIRNDLKFLTEKGFLKREGRTHQSAYIFKRDI